MKTNGSGPTPSRTRLSQSPRTPSRRPCQPPTASTSYPTSVAYTSTSSYAKESSLEASISSQASLSSLRGFISENPHIYDITEIRAATNNFLAKRYSPSSSSFTASSVACWRCNIRGRDTVVFQRMFRRKIQTSQLKERLSILCRSNHTSIIKLLGASISGDHIYLVYEFIEGSNLVDCLRNPRNSSFTVLSKWMSRMQIATDLAHGLDYVHNNTGLNLSIVHNRVKSSSIIVTESSFNAKVCHFGTAQLCGETDESYTQQISHSKHETEIEEGGASSFGKLKRSVCGERQFEVVRDYMSPEFRSTGVAAQKSDVFAFGVVMLELLSGKEPLKYRYDKKTGDFLRTSVMDTAAMAVMEGRERLRRWIDGRLNDSFPVEVAEKLIRLALDCVHVDPNKRPDMGRVAGKISKLYLESRIWSDKVKIPTGISVSLAPR